MAALLGDWLHDGQPSDSCGEAALAHAVRRGWCAAGSNSNDAAMRMLREEVEAATGAELANRAAALAADASMSLAPTLCTPPAPHGRSETPLARCDACGTVRMADAAPPLKACGRCRRAFYCDAACQAAHWRDHRAHGCAPRGAA
jgi:hypothetical protein